MGGNNELEKLDVMVVGVVVEAEGRRKNT